MGLCRGDNGAYVSDVAAEATITVERNSRYPSRIVLPIAERWQDRREDLRGVTCPTIILCGVDDERTPLPLSEEMAELIPTSRLITLAKCGHLPPLEKPFETTQHLKDWLLGDGDVG